MWLHTAADEEIDVDPNYRCWWVSRVWVSSRHNERFNLRYGRSRHAACAAFAGECPHRQACGNRPRLL
jgi:hypothetical protein